MILVAYRDDSSWSKIHTKDGYLLLNFCFQKPGKVTIAQKEDESSPDVLRGVVQQALGPWISTIRGKRTTIQVCAPKQTFRGLDDIYWTRRDCKG